MKTIACIVILSVCCFSSSPISAQEHSSAQPQQWLQKFVGQWEVGDGEGAAGMTGSIEGRMLGDQWVVNETIAVGGGMKVHAMQTIGFDKQKNKFVGTWVDSTSEYIWHYEGTIDEENNTLNLEAEGPNIMGGGEMAQFRDSYEFKTDDHIIARSFILSEDGEWNTFMTADAKRKK